MIQAPQAGSSLRRRAVHRAGPGRRPRVAYISPDKLSTPPWMVGYGLFQGGVTAGDSLQLFFGAAVLGMTPAAVGLLDAASSITLTLGAVGLAFVLPRIARSNNLFVLSIVGVGIVLAIFALVNNAFLALALAVVLGFLLAPSSVLSPIMATTGVPRSHWGEAFSHLNRVASLGGAVGLAGAALWLTTSEKLGSTSLAVRLLFLGIGSVAVLGALYSHGHLATAIKRHREMDSHTDGLVNLHPSIKSKQNSLGISQPFLSDQLLIYLALSFLLFAGMGMSFSGVHAYLVQDLRVSLALAMGAVLGFKITSYFSSQPFSRGIAQVLPLQVQSLVCLGRAAAVAAVAALSFLPGSVAFPLVIILVTLWGVSGGALAVTGAEVTARLAVPGRWKESMTLYVAVSNAGAIAGISLGGDLSSVLGFEAMFMASAALIAVSAILFLRN